MADCPKCGKHIKIYQMSPYCKNCGTHLMFASFEGQFEKDRRIAEMSMANFRYNLVKFKSAYASGKAQKLKIASVFFPLIALLLPMGNLTVTSPLYSSDISFNIIGLFVEPFFLNGLFGKLDAFSLSPVFGDVVSSLKTLMLIYAAAAVCAVLVLLLELICFIGNKKVQILTVIFSAAGIAAIIAAGIFAFSLKAAAEVTGSIVTVSISFLFILAAFLFAVPLVSALFCLKNPPVYSFREGDELRVEYRRKYKKGEIKLLDIPTPIYESEEDKTERRKLISEAYNINEDEEVTEDVRA